MAIQAVNEVTFLPLRVLRLAGMWAPNHPRARCLYNIYSAFLLSTYVLGTASILAEVLRVEYGPVSSEIICITVQCISSIGKALTFLWQREQFQFLLKDLSALPPPPPGSAGAKALARATREGNTVSAVLVSTGFVALSLWPMLSKGRENKMASARCRERLMEAGVNVTADDCRVRALPTDTWFPFDINEDWNYNFAFAFEMEWGTGMFINEIMQICLNVSLMLQIAAQGRALAERLRAVGDVSELHECVRHHQRFIQSVKGLQDVTGPGILCHYLCSLVVICLCLFNLTKVSSIIIKIYFFAFFLTTFGEVFLLCWYGEGVTSSGEEVARAVYECPWPDAPLRMRRELITVIMRSQPNLYIRSAGGFRQLSRRTFLSLMQTSYSLYTLLVAMDE